MERVTKTTKEDFSARSLLTLRLAGLANLSFQLHSTFSLVGGAPRGGLRVRALLSAQPFHAVASFEIAVAVVHRTAVGVGVVAQQRLDRPDVVARTSSFAA